MYSRRWVLSALLAGVAQPGFAEAPSSSPRPEPRPGRAATLSQSQVTGKGRAIVEEANLGGAVSFVVAETATGRVLESHDADTALPPASVAKTMTTFYALDRLGPQHRFTTRVLGTGPIRSGRLQGDLILAGTGDPTLDTDALGALAASLAARGVTTVAGRFLAYGGGVPYLSQIDGNQPGHVGYNPAIAGLNLNYKGTRLTEEWTVSARALGKGGNRWLPVRHPQLYTAEVFATLMRAHGLSLPPVRLIDSLPAAAVLAEQRSEALDEMIRDMLRWSTNLTAEVLGLSASGAPSLRTSARLMTDWAAGRGVSAKLVDHSGLSGDNRIAAAEMVKMLRAARNTALPDLLRDKGLYDVGGRENKEDPVRVRAKTGTLNFVSGLAGYIAPGSGPELTFAILSADIQRRDRLPMSQRENPKGGKHWIRRARNMQNSLVRSWAGQEV